MEVQKFYLNKALTCDMDKLGNTIIQFLVVLILFNAISFYLVAIARAQRPDLDRERALQNLIDAMDSEDWEVRERAVRIAGKVRESIFVEPLIRLASSDPNIYVRDRAIWTLGAYGDQRAIEPLVSILKDADATLRQRGIEALGKIGGAESENALAGLLLYEENEVVRNLALDQLLSLADRRFVALLKDELANPDARVRRNAVEALAETKEPELLETFVDILKSDPESSIRRLAAHFLGELKSAEAFDALIIAIGDESADVRREAAESLLKLNDSRAVAPLAKALRDKDRTVRKTAIQALGILKAPEVVPDLIDIVDSTSSSYERKSAILALTEIGDPRRVAILVRTAMYEQDPDVRIEAEKAISRIRDPEITRQLIAYLQDEDSVVRQTAAIFLGRRIDASALEPLAGLALEDPEPSVRMSASKSLGAIDASESWRLLSRALDSEALAVRLRAVEALKNIRSIGAETALIGALQNENPAVRAQAASALGEIRTIRAIDPLIDRLKDPDKDVVINSSHALMAITHEKFGLSQEQWEAWSVSQKKSRTD